MRPHLTPIELDFIQTQEALGKCPIGVHRALASRRAWLPASLATKAVGAMPGRRRAAADTKGFSTKHE